ncbi:MAG: UDP-N-acetylmuramoyl-L-alanyl-D-glutamate--2,6-diaminopimelate ligase [Thermoleophilia bacterium]
MKLSEVLSQVPVVRQDGSQDSEITGLTYDSRRVQPGFLFIAIPGFKTDGHDFVPQAIENGAAAILTERWIEKAGVPQMQTDLARRSMAQAAANFYGHPSAGMTLVGVTGTNGKTTTTFLLDEILRTGGRKTGLIGGVEYRTGDQAFTASRTTPESVELQRLLAEMSQAGVEVVTLEVSSHGIDLYRVACLAFDVAVFTNLTSEHLDLHGDMESYFDAKRRLFLDDLESADITEPGGSRPVGVINVDDAYGRKLASELTDSISFGLAADADVTATDIRAIDDGTGFTLSLPSGATPAGIHLPGDYNLSNALAAAGAAFALGFSPQTIARGLEAAAGPPGRFEVMDLPTPYSVIIDYAHNEDGLAKALAAAGRMTTNRLIVVFGCPGERDREKRPRMGRVAGSLADLAILTTDDCYDEPPEQILDETEPGLKASGVEYVRIPDRRQAIAIAIDRAAPGDTILIAGKGHETRQMMADGARPFSDRQVVTEIIAAS